MRNLLMLLAAMVLQQVAYSQITFAGRWAGALNEVRNLKLSFNITEEKDSLKATLDVPSQGAKDVPCTKVTVIKDSIRIDMKMLNGWYEGKLTDVNKIDGVWTQNGMGIPLVLTRTLGKIELNRPQTPKPPYTYNSEDIIFYSENKGLYYGATITTPKDGDKHPALIMITGSGPQNRDEEIFGHKPFAVVADHLTKQGYVVLRVDDRGVGKSGGDRTNTTSADYAQDVKEAIHYLKSRKEVDKKKIGLYGHSEGGMIAQMVAAESKDVAFIILMAAPGIKVTELMTEQNKAVLASGGLDAATVESYAKLYKGIVEQVAKATNQDTLRVKLINVVDKWLPTADKNTIATTIGITDVVSKEKFVDEFMSQIWNKWWAFFLQYDPQPVLSKLSCKVLALNGDKDIQVLSRSNLEGINKALASSKSKDYETREVTGVNHLFQECTTCTAQEYGELEQTIKPEVLDIVTTWLNEHVK